ncbi:MAG: site-2 protease family protein [Flavobacteriales bacterium]|nr:site-2 protease family protein [Flavobacteriales bacterium]
MAAPTLGGSLALFSFRGIKVHVHWTFLLLVAWVVFSVSKGGGGPREIAVQLAMLAVVFGCVVLHEYGHALTALHYHVRTRDITLLPIGGMASLERMPEDPLQELWITVAGPAVNLVIAAIAAVALNMLYGFHLLDPMGPGPLPARALTLLFAFNIGLFLFNLLPAFPMDGGRILRALLSMRMPRTQATRIAASVGRMMAIGLLFAGLFFGEPFLALIGVFVLIGAGAELRAARERAALTGVTVRQMMRTSYWAMEGHSSVQQAVDALLAGGDHDLVVLSDGRYRGILTRKRLIEALSADRGGSRLDEIPLLEARPVPPDAPARSAFANAMAQRWPLLPVQAPDGELLGVVDAENYAEFIMVQQAREAGRTRHTD